MKYVEAPLVVEAPGQLPNLPSPKSGPGQMGEWVGERMDEMINFGK